MPRVATATEVFMQLDNTQFTFDHKAEVYVTHEFPIPLLPPLFGILIVLGFAFYRRRIERKRQISR